MGSPSYLSPAQGAPALPTPGVQNLRPRQLTHFNIDQAGPPSNLYISLNDGLTVTVNDWVGGITVLVEIQYLLPSGELIVQEERIATVAFAGGNVVKTFRMPECFLLRIGLSTIGSSFRGQVWCAIGILHAGVAGQQMLAQGFVDVANRLQWPSGVWEPQVSGQGFYATQAITNPAVGADISFANLANARVRVVGMIATLTTSATVANRLVQLVTNDGTRNAQPALAAAVQAASLAIQYLFTPVGSSIAPVGTIAQLSIPTPMTLMPSWLLNTLTQNIQAGDQWSAITLALEKWFDQ